MLAPGRPRADPPSPHPLRTQLSAPPTRPDLPALDGGEPSPRPARPARPGHRGRRRQRSTGRAALALLPAVAVLGVVGTLLVGESATTAAVGEQIASLQTSGSALHAQAQLLQTTLAQVRSAGTVEVGAAAAGLAPPAGWTTVPAAATGPRDPLAPVLHLLGWGPATPTAVAGPPGRGPTRVSRTARTRRLARGG